MSADTWDVSAINAIGVLDESTYLGGVYSGMLAGILIADILTNHAYTVSNDIAGIPIYGYLPVCTRREALQQVLFSIGAVAYHDCAGIKFDGSHIYCTKHLHRSIHQV